MNTNMNVSMKTKRMVLLAIFCAIIIVMANVPYLGFLNLGVVSATLIHIPVMIGAILLGPKFGAALGFVFGMTSFLNATFRPNLTSFCFSPFVSGGNVASLVVCFLPRILIGVTAYYVFAGLRKLLVRGEKKKLGETIALAAGGVAGSMTNTILVMGLIYLLFAESYAKATGIASNAVFGAVMAIVGMNGVPEAIVAGIITTLVCRVMLHIKLD